MSEASDFREPKWYGAKAAAGLSIKVCTRCGARIARNMTKCGSCQVLEKVMAEREQKRQHYQTLKQRMTYLGHRVEAKQKTGWEFEYDEGERKALEWALSELSEYA
jgi:ribosomal protein L40E